MNLKFVSLFVIALVFVALSNCEENANTEDKISFEKFQTVINSIRILLYGAKQEDDIEYKKDLFVDTRKGVLNSLDNLIDMVHVDEIIRIFFQSLVLITAQNVRFLL
jgi:hypothetical protein